MDEDEHFEDFTTASDWELFTAKLEQLLSEWMGKPTDSENTTNSWNVIHEKITFSDVPFKFTYFKKIAEKLPSESSSSLTVSASGAEVFSSSITNTTGALGAAIPPYLNRNLKNECGFPPKYVPHVVAEYFNVDEFAVISSAGLEPVEKESKLKVLLSSACMALNNTSCNFPIFVQFHHWSQSYFCGIAESSGIRSSFQMVMLKQNGNLPTHLSGLLDVFKSKIGPNLSVPVSVSAHFFYKMKTWPAELTCDSFPPEMLEMIENGKPISSGDNQEITPTWNQYVAHTAFLPFGSLDDPFVNLDFVTGWPSLAEDVVVDSASYSDLEPENAQEWYFSLKPDPNAEFRLHDLVDGIWSLRNDQRTVEQVLGKSIDDNKGSVKYTSALDRITRSAVPDIPVAGINKVLNTAQRQVLYNPQAYEDLPPIEKMDQLIKFLFPDATKDPDYPYLTTMDQTPDFQKEHMALVFESLQGVKSAPIGSLVWRLAVVMGYLHAYAGGVSAFAHLWAEFVLELRFRVDNSIVVCGLERGSPNSGTCLLNQKLQMLNCCIDKKLFREVREKEKFSADPNAVESGCEESEEDEDEFFDCEENLATSENVSKLNKPTGRARKNGRLRLVKTGEPMYLPVTQDPPPLTEDMMEDQAKVIIELGEDAQASEMRAKMMSASLVSDMESFKAANPGAELEDFVRWYSPRDWIELEETDEFGNKVGELSPRMKVPGNLWLEVWSTAQAIPARRQRRLFDDTKESEKVLHWLSTRSLSDVSQLLFPCLVHTATLKLLEEADKLDIEYKIPQNLSQYVLQLSRCFSFISRPDSNVKDTNNYKSHVMNIISRCEKEMTQIRSFQQKFPGISLEKILERKETERDTYGNEFFPSFVKVEGENKSDVGKVIKDLFYKELLAKRSVVEIESEFRFGNPFKRVFVLNYNPVTSSVINSYSVLPQRMSCLLKEDIFVLAGTFSSKTDLS